MSDAKGITVNALISRLQDLVAQDPSVGELETLAEGCDCYGECLDAYVTHKGWTKTVVLLARSKEAAA